VSTQDVLAVAFNANQLARRLLAGQVSAWRSFLPIRFSKKRREVHKKLRTLEKSRIFDRQWYLETYPEGQTHGIDPLLEYLLFGGFEGRQPNPHFDSGWYLSSNHDVRRAGTNPLLHYILYGAKERRPTSPSIAAVE